MCFIFITPSPPNTNLHYQRKLWVHVIMDPLYSMEVSENGLLLLWMHTVTRSSLAVLYQTEVRFVFCQYEWEVSIHASQQEFNRDFHTQQNDKELRVFRWQEYTAVHRSASNSGILLQAFALYTDLEWCCKCRKNALSCAQHKSFSSFTTHTHTHTVDVRVVKRISIKD